VAKKMVALWGIWDVKTRAWLPANACNVTVPSFVIGETAAWQSSKGARSEREGRVYEKVARFATLEIEFCEPPKGEKGQ
jgi:hypothetical protein